MRSASAIKDDAKRKEDLMIEILLDIRDIIIKATKKKRKT